MIGLFDSWFGWLQTMKDFYNLYPQYDYIFLADTKNCPYWEKSQEEIKKFTFKWLHRLFDNWADIVILACNTAAAYSIRDRQNQYPEKKVLSITIPGIERILQDYSDKTNIWILATQATILSNIYTDLFLKFGWEDNPDFQFIIAPKLVNIIEKGFKDQKKVNETISEYLNKFDNISHLILGCTHFPVLIEDFKKQFKWVIIDPSLEAAKRFWPYLEKHQEIASKLSENSERIYYTTWDIQSFEDIWSKIFWEPIEAHHIQI